MKILKSLAGIALLALGLLSISSPSYAQVCSNCNTVTDTIYTASGGLATGNITIVWADFTASDGHQVKGSSRSLSLTSGVFSVKLEPNTGATPTGTSYTVYYDIAGGPSGAAAREYWVVPISPSPAHLADVRNINAPVPGSIISLSWLSGSGAVSGYCIVFSGGNAVWMPCPGGSGSGAFGAITSGTNTIATMLVGNTASLSPTGSGIISANRLNNVALSGLGTGLIKNTTGTGLPSIALAADVYALWGGVCDNSTYLRGDGVCVSPPGSGTVTHTLGALTLDQLMFGAGGADSKVGNLLGDVTTSGTNVTTIGNGKVTNFMLAGSIAKSKLIGTDIDTVGTITTGTWNANPIPVVYGGLGGNFSSIAKGGIVTGAGAGVFGITPVGTDGYVLIADSASTTGVKWDVAGSGSGSVTSIATTAPISGGTITATGTISCPTCVTAGSALTTGRVLLGAGSQASAISVVSIDGSGNVTGLGTISLGTSPPACVLGSGGGICSKEGTAMTAAATVDDFWADSTAHRWKMHNNGGSGDVVVGAATTDTFTNKSLSEAQVTFTNNTSGDCNPAAHGYSPLPPNNANYFLDGTCHWTLPPGGSGATLTAGPYAVFGLGAGTTALLAGDTPAFQVVVDQFVAAFNGMFTTDTIYIGSSLGAGKAVIVGYYNSTCSSLLAYARSVNPATGTLTLTLSSTLNLTGGAVYYRAVSTEAEFTPIAMGAIGNAGYLLYNAASNSHFVAANPASGSGSGYTLPAACGTIGGQSYYSVVQNVLRP